MNTARNHESKWTQSTANGPKRRSKQTKSINFEVNVNQASNGRQPAAIGEDLKAIRFLRSKSGIDFESRLKATASDCKRLQAIASNRKLLRATATDSSKCLVKRPRHQADSSNGRRNSKFFPEIASIIYKSKSFWRLLKELSVLRPIAHMRITLYLPFAAVLLKKREF